MPEQPHKTLMDRDQPPKVMAEKYGAQLHLLTQMTNYASNLIPRAFQSSEKKLRDVIVCFTFLKQIAAMLDAIDVLVRAGAITAAFVPARVAFEAALYLEPTRRESPLRVEIKARLAGPGGVSFL